MVERCTERRGLPEYLSSSDGLKRSGRRRRLVSGWPVLRLLPEYLSSSDGLKLSVKRITNKSPVPSRVPFQFRWIETDSDPARSGAAAWLPEYLSSSDGLKQIPDCSEDLFALPSRVPFQFRWIETRAAGDDGAQYEHASRVPFQFRWIETWFRRKKKKPLWLLPEYLSSSDGLKPSPIVWLVLRFTFQSTFPVQMDWNKYTWPRTLRRGFLPEYLSSSDGLKPPWPFRPEFPSHLPEYLSSSDGLKLLLLTTKG